MNDHHLVSEFRATIVTGKDTVSEVIGSNGKYSCVPFAMYSTGVVFMPASFTGTELRFKVAPAGSDNFVDVLDATGNPIKIPVSAGKATILPAEIFEPMPYVRPVLTNSSGVAQAQTANTVMIFVLKT
jgi:hypothetical protein